MSGDLDFVKRNRKMNFCFETCKKNTCRPIPVDAIEKLPFIQTINHGDQIQDLLKERCQCRNEEE